MDNVWTLMVLPTGQAQALVLQFKSHEKAVSPRDMIDPLGQHGADRVTITDDFGRNLRLHPNDVQITLVQDVAAAVDGNVLSNLHNAIANALTQVRADTEVKMNQKVKNAVTSNGLAQSINTAGAIRQ